MILAAPPNLLTEHWQITVNRADPRALRLYERHYSAHQYADGRERNQFVAPGEYVALMTAALDALFVWQKSKYRADEQQGVNCAVFRNESRHLSSLLIEEAMHVGQERWWGERFFTFVDPTKVRSRNPGCCFKKAGWRSCGITQSGLLIFEWHSGF